MRNALILIVLAFSALGVSAQVNGVPPSVLSPAPGRGFAPPASVTSLGPRGYNVGPPLLGIPGQTRFGGGIPKARIGHRHVRRYGYGGYYGGGYYVPYAVPAYPYYDQAPSDVVIDPQTGQVISADRPMVGYTNAPDRNAPYATPYAQPNTVVIVPQAAAPAAQQAANVPPPAPQAAPATAPEAVEAQPSTVLVFNDGRQIEITNYAIQGTTLFNFSGKGPRKIALADLNVPETVKLNDDRGVEFSVPRLTK